MNARSFDDFAERVRTLIQANELEPALEELNSISRSGPPDLGQEIALQTSRYNKLRRD